MNDSVSLRHTFDEVASLYNEVRPRYPDALFRSLIGTTHLSADSKILEIGAGTGQATVPLTKKGYHITAIELGKSLAKFAEQELREYQNVRILNTSFEEAILPSKSFDLVYAATSFHWIDPLIKYAKTHSILKDGSFLAIIHTNHVSDDKGDKFFTDSISIFDHHGFVNRNQKPRLPTIGELKPDDIDRSRFRLIDFQLFPVVIKYTAKTFSRLLNTYSNHLAASKEIQQAFYHDIENFIDEHFNGEIDKHFCMSLTVAQKI